jgi:hypothetical protein
MRRLTSLALVATLAFLPTPSAHAWGNDGHRMINRLAGQFLPADVPAFLRNGSALDTLEYLGPEPDRWRNRAESELSATQAADHFIDLEFADLLSPLPHKRYDFDRAIEKIAEPGKPNSMLTPEKVGLQPWATEEMWQKLKVDLREYRKLVAANQDTAPVQAAIFYDAGILGHYVGDGSMPLHTTIQYNGWTGPNPNGYTTDHKIHALFESINVSANVRISDLAPLVAASKPTPFDDEWKAYMDYLRHTNTFVEKTYQLEKAGGFTGAGTPEGKAFTDERLAAGAIQLRDMIYSAWLHSADPVEEYKGN